MRRPLLALLAAAHAGFAGYLALGWLLRPWYRRWGATDDELRRALPGDELVPRPLVQSTWAVSIEAPPEQVWPWLVQMGQGCVPCSGVDPLAGGSAVQIMPSSVPVWHLLVGGRAGE